MEFLILGDIVEIEPLGYVGPAGPPEGGGGGCAYEPPGSPWNPKF